MTFHDYFFSKDARVTSDIPHFGHEPGFSLWISGCMGQV